MTIQSLMSIYTHTFSGSAGPLVMKDEWYLGPGQGYWQLAGCLYLPSIKQVSEVHSEAVSSGAGPWWRVSKQVFTWSLPTMGSKATPTCWEFTSLWAVPGKFCYLSISFSMLTKLWPCQLGQRRNRGRNIIICTNSSPSENQPLEYTPSSLSFSVCFLFAAQALRHICS